ncbi:unnamed protein product [marine sediment metagenome]|uniref:Uncharacterized protein n=1 Tax=marine sediment metagenome TaxID=412755 RepID=X1L9H3_9ZZZZ
MTILELANKIIDDWHADDDNFPKAEPDGLKLARMIKAGIPNDIDPDREAMDADLP